MEFQVTPGWLAFHPHPSTPTFRVPPGAVDAHCHVFGPGAVFPYAPERKYTPCDAGKDVLFALRDRLGFDKSVIVQATCHGTDNRALVDALRAAGGRARGVATVDRRVTDAELHELHEAGVRGARFNFIKRLVDFTPREVLTEIAHRIAPLGWHVVVYFEAADLPELWDFFTTLPTAVVVDHMGRPDVSQPVDGPEFERFVRLMREHTNVWSKVSCPERLSVTGPPAVDGERQPYRDVIPFARRLVETFPDRVLWGTDWPHPNLKNHMPDDGLLVDYIPHIAPTADLRQKLLVDNPTRLYLVRFILPLVFGLLVSFGCGRIPGQDVRYEPTPMPVVRALLALAEVGPQDLVYDLGSGDGRIPITAAQEFGARGVGIEIDPALVAQARANAREAGVEDKVDFRSGDMYATDVRSATVVTLFLHPGPNLKLRDKLRADLPPGARVVSYVWNMGSWTPTEVRSVGERSIFLWRIPSRRGLLMDPAAVYTRRVWDDQQNAAGRR